MDRASKIGRPSDRSPGRLAAVDVDDDAFGHEGHALARDGAVDLALDPPGNQPERELPQGGQVGLGEGTVEGDPGALGRIDVAVLHALSKGVGTHVDELDLVGIEQHLIGEALVHRSARDRRDGIGDRLQVLHVQGRHHVDAGVADGLDVLPALRARRAGHIRVRQLVDERDGRSARDDRDRIHLLDDDAAVVHVDRRHDLEPPKELGRMPSPMGLDVPDDEVRPTLQPPMALLEHPVRLAHTRRHPEVHTESTARAPLIGADALEHLVG